MTKPSLFVDDAQQLTPKIEVGSLVKFHEEPPLIVQVTSTTSELDGCFTGVDLSNGFYSDNWDYSLFHLFVGSLTLTQGV